MGRPPRFKVGDRVGTRVVIGDLGSNSNSLRVLKVRCDCGRETRMNSTSLGMNLRCRTCVGAGASDMPAPKRPKPEQVEIGAQFGKWIVVRKASRIGSDQAVWLECECGNKKRVAVPALKALADCSPCKGAVPPPKLTASHPVVSRRVTVMLFPQWVDWMRSQPSPVQPYPVPRKYWGAYGVKALRDGAIE